MRPGGTMSKNSIMQRLKLALGYPVAVATDTITISQKSWKRSYYSTSENGKK